MKAVTVPKMLIAALAITLLTIIPVFAGKVDKMSLPTIACAGSTQTSITLQVTAGATGAPAGFSLHWMKAEDFAANGDVWPESDCVPGTESGCAASFCAASFSGNANLSRYNLGPYQSVMVNIGDFLFDNGASTSCPVALECGTAYVFRAFAHANSALKRSDFTAAITCSTLPCGNQGTCTLTQGFWKTHGPIPTGNNTNAWPVTSLKLGNVTYTDQQLLDILNTPASGNGLIALAHQLIAAKFNILSGADPSTIGEAVDAADALIGSQVIPPVGAAALKAALTSSLTTELAGYNEGLTGPGHCK